MTAPCSTRPRKEASRNTLPRGIDRVEITERRPWILHVVHSTEPVAPAAIGRRSLRIGREADAGADLVLPDPSVSRVHATVAPVAFDDSLVLDDRGSSNGVFVNGQRVARRKLEAGDVVRLGDSILVVGRGPIEDAPAADLGLLGRSPSIAAIRAMIRRVAPSALPVLIQGPTGTGKELVARAVHAESGRRGAFVALNCAALPAALVESLLFGHTRGAYTSAVTDEQGAFVRAAGGTLFLDEVGDLALEAQPKLLRALESGEVIPIGSTRAVTVDVRVVAATNKPLDPEAFRGDLHARLAGVVVRTPALAEHREDILLLFRSFLAAPERPLSADFVESLLVHAWPHNVRELRKLAERLEVLHPDAARFERGMVAEDLPLPVPVTTSPPEAPAERRKAPPSREELVELLARCDGNVSRVAGLVSRNRKQVYRWMERLGLDRGTGRS